MKTVIENEILEISKNILENWQEKFSNNDITVDDLFVYKSDRNNYYSEIEFNFWKNNSFKTFFSLIIYLNGELIINMEDIEQDINDEIEQCFKQIVNEGN